LKRRIICALISILLALWLFPIGSVAVEGAIGLTSWQELITLSETEPSLQYDNVNNSFTFLSGSFEIASTAIFEIPSDGSIKIENGTALSVSGQLLASGTLTVENGGMLTIDGGTLTVTSIVSPLVNNGTILINSGSLSIEGGTLISNGTIVNADTILVGGAFENNGAFTLKGIGRVVLENGGSITGTNANAVTRPKGDVNGDGYIRNDDVKSILSYRIGDVSLEETQLPYGDMDSTNVVDLMDVLLLCKILPEGEWSHVYP
jgi:hypothetical protein